MSRWIRCRVAPAAECAPARETQPDRTPSEPLLSEQLGICTRKEMDNDVSSGVYSVA